MRFQSGTVNPQSRWPPWQATRSESSSSRWAQMVALWWLDQGTKHYASGKCFLLLLLTRHPIVSLITVSRSFVDIYCVYALVFFIDFSKNRSYFFQKAYYKIIKCGLWILPKGLIKNYWSYFRKTPTPTSPSSHNHFNSTWCPPTLSWIQHISPTFLSLKWQLI